MISLRPPLYLLLTILLCQCSSDIPTAKLSDFSITSIPLDVGPSGMPNLFVNKNQDVLLSWLSFINDSTDVLQFSTLKENTWGAAKTIASGNDWFANWADFPSMVALGNNDQNLVAHYLQYAGEGTYDYDIKLRSSKNGGTTWSAPIKLHKDTVQAEHGFVSLLPLDDQNVLAVWLDGRFTKMDEPSLEKEDHHGHGAGPMTLRAAQVNIDNGKISEEVELDNSVCDCCQTNVAMGTEGPIVVYRDRSLGEIRDIYVVRKLKSGWTLPKVIHSDNWEIAGCPVNGPAIATQGNNVAVAWFTMAQDTPKVMLALSTNDGANFQKVIPIDLGNPIGRVDLTFAHEKNELIVSWIEKEKEKGNIYLRRVAMDGTLGKAQKIMDVSASRNSGFPILKKIKNGYLLAHTKVEEKGEEVTTVVETIIIK